MVLNVPNGTNLNMIPLIAETGATAPAVLQGFVTATKGASPATADVTLAALQTVSPGGTSATRQITIPLESIQAVGATLAVDSTGSISAEANTNCPTGSPVNANCAKQQHAPEGYSCDDHEGGAD